MFEDFDVSEGKVSTGKLQDNYENYEEFESYSEIYGLAQRLGFEGPKDAWDANPKIQWSTDPNDFKIVKAGFPHKPASGSYEEGKEMSRQAREDPKHWGPK